MPPPIDRFLEAPASPRPPPALSDDLLEEIFLRVACPADVARASAACTTFRRLVTSDAFLQRYRSLHPPLLLGFIDTEPSFFHPADALHPNATAARSIAPPAADFSFDYFRPTCGRPWNACDVRDGRVLVMNRPITGIMGYIGTSFPDLAVCNPLFRRYQQLPPIPYDLLVSVHAEQQDYMSFEAFLVPGEVEDGASFRVIGKAHIMPNKSVVFVFSSGSGLWSVGTTWDDLILGNSVLICRSYAYGSIYWKMMHGNKLFKLDINSMDFSIIDLPLHYIDRDVIIVEEGEGRVGVFSHIKFGMPVVYHTIQQKKSEIAVGCESETTLLPVYYDCSMVGAAEGYIFFVGFPKDSSADAASFSLQVKTLKVEMVCQMALQSCNIHPYFGYPPFMSSRRI